MVMEALLVSMHGEQYLFERNSNGHGSKLFECSLWTFPKPGIMKHTISRRSANGIPVPCKETNIMQRIK